MLYAGFLFNAIFVKTYRNDTNGITEIEWTGVAWLPYINWLSPGYCNYFILNIALTLPYVRGGCRT